MKNLRDESGQAIAELTVALIPILLVILACMFAVIAGLENIHVLKSARASADNESGLRNATNVKNWGEYGNDEILFTADDEEALSIAGSEDVTVMKDALMTTQEDLEMNISDLDDFVYYNFTQNFPSPTSGPMPDYFVYLSAGDLIEGTGTPSGMMSKGIVTDLKNSIENVFEISLNLNLSDNKTNKVYMPAKYGN